MDTRINIMAGRLPLPENVLERTNLLAFADAHHVLGQLAVTCLDKTEGKTAEVLENGLFRAAFDHQMLRFEMDRLERTLLGSGICPVVLKGGAYVAVGSKAGLGRRVSDLDILVAGDEIDQTEVLLKDADWVWEAGVDNEYDSNYYRKYMHELPPLRHKKRRTIIDVHHMLLPRTSTYKIRSDLMYQAAQFIQGTQLKVFTPIDRYIHSAIHSFADGSFDTPTRSVLELNLLFCELTYPERSKLIIRSKEVGAARPVAIALWLQAEVLGDTAAIEALNALGPNKAGSIVKYAFKQKLIRSDKSYIAKLLLLVRGHLIRMPIHLLAVHGLKKAFRFIRKLAAKESPTAS